jgi:hypothetical protein
MSTAQYFLTDTEGLTLFTEPPEDPKNCNSFDRIDDGTDDIIMSGNAMTRTFVPAIRLTDIQFRALREFARNEPDFQPTRDRQVIGNSGLVCWTKGDRVNFQSRDGQSAIVYDKTAVFPALWAALGSDREPGKIADNRVLVTMS